jgi:hypothetical protein
LSDRLFTRKEDTPSYVLEWSLTAKGTEEIVLAYAIKAFEELYVSDRLWDRKRDGIRIKDPFGIYRFVRDGSLRLAFTQAPYPPNVSPMEIFQPLFSKVDAGQTHGGSVSIALPVDEYSSLARNIAAPNEIVTVTRVHFALGYALRSELRADPIPPIKETAEEAGYIVHTDKRIVSTCDVPSRIQVKQRTEYMARFALMGEPAPAPMPLH